MNNYINPMMQHQQPMLNQQQMFPQKNFQMGVNNQQQGMMPPGMGMPQQQMFMGNVNQPMQQHMYNGINQQPVAPSPMVSQGNQMMNQPPMNYNAVNQRPTANNPEYHPVLMNPNLKTHKGWELQMFLATISRTFMGSEGTAYAIQSVVDITPQQLGGTNVSSLQNELSNTLVNATKASLIELANSTIQQPQDEVMAGMSPQVNQSDLATSSNILMQHKKLTQYNIDDEDDESLPKKIIMDEESDNKDHLWHVLDLSNISLSIVNDRLMNFDFLNRLYLNGTGIKKVPKSIKKLVNLRILDLSDNQLTELPKEIGFLHNLKYFYVFDNHIKTFPWEFGFLISLQFLGFEGNPIDNKLLQIYLEKNITGLLFYLRDNRPAIELKEDRQFLELDSQGEFTGTKTNTLKELNDSIAPIKSRSFTLLSYNTLCQHYATPKMYKYTTKHDLMWSHRLEVLKQQIESYQTDIICLQEVEAKTYEDVWEPLLASKGYKGIFFAKGRARTSAQKDAKKVDGCCVFYKVDEFELLYHKECEFSAIWMQNPNFSKTEDFFSRAISKDNVVIYTHFLHKRTNRRVWVCTTHLHWDPKFNDVKAFQVGVLLHHLNTLIHSKPYEGKHGNHEASVVVCGDFNSQRDSAVYEMFHEGSVSREHLDVKDRDYGYLTETNFKHSFAFKSAYEDIGELRFTNYTPSFVDVIDYIWYSPNTMRVRGLLGDIDEEYTDNFIGFPNDKFPSDHIPLLSKFEFC